MCILLIQLGENDHRPLQAFEAMYSRAVDFGATARWFMDQMKVAKRCQPVFLLLNPLISLARAQSA